MINLYPSWFTFLVTNLIGVIIISSSTNWFFIWIGLELSLFGFLPLFLPNNTSIESITNYLLIQAGGSTLFLIAFLSSSILSPNIIILSISANLGLFPFFQWVPSIISSINWMGCLILSTIQNLGPIIILINIQPNYFFLLLICSTSILLSGIIGINQTYIRPLIGYSSISHTAWITASIIPSHLLPVIYVLLYFLTSSILISILHHNNTSNVIINNNHISHPNVINLLIISISGLPPFTLFFLNISVLLLIWECNYTFIMFPIILGSICSAYFYLTFVIPSITNNWSINTNNITLLTLLSIINLPIILIL